MRHILILIVLATAAWLFVSPVSANQVTCESRNNQRSQCPIDTRYEVRLVRKLSDASCDEGRDWGAGNGYVWVDRGCRGVFGTLNEPESGGSGSGGSRPTSTTCESRNNQRTECRIDTSGTVRLTRKMSDSSCVEGTSWGTGRGFVWVDRGCRAAFEATGGGDTGGGQGGASGPTRVTCESRGNRREYCDINTRGRVVLVKKLSHTDCEQGRDWGTERGQVWVDRGCRAVFESSGHGSSGGNNRPLPREVTCESRGNRREYCDMDTMGQVRLSRRLSNADCEKGYSWDIDTNRVWVDRGCRAVFENTGFGNSGGNRPDDGYNGNAGDPPSWAVRACNAYNDWYGTVVNWTDLKPGAYEIILDYDRRGRYVCNVESGGRVTYFEQLRR